MLLEHALYTKHIVQRSDIKCLQPFFHRSELGRLRPPNLYNNKLIRDYGLSASRVKTAYKTITDKLLGKASDVKTAKNWRERQTDFQGKDPLVCSICQTVMVFVTAHIPNPLPMIKARLKSTYS